MDIWTEDSAARSREKCTTKDAASKLAYLPCSVLKPNIPSKYTEVMTAIRLCQLSTTTTHPLVFRANRVPPCHR